MKRYSKILFLAAALTGLASWAVHEIQEFEVATPETLAQYEYLKEYDVLKNYVDRTASPDFKLGAGVVPSQFVKHGQAYLMSVSNFDEVVPLKDMYHASIVGNNGKMNFGDVETFVEEAQAANLSVYGPALAWHLQQNSKFLNTQVADWIDPNYTPEYVEQIKFVKRNCCMVEALDMKEQAWDSQFWIAVPTTFKEGDEWEVSMDIYALKEAAPGTQIHAAPSAYLHWAAIGNPEFKTEWTTWSASGTIPAEGKDGYSIAFNLNDFQQANTYYFDNVSFKLNGVEQITNGDFEDPETNVNFYSKTYGQDANPRFATIVSEYKKIELVEIPKTQYVERKCILVESDDMSEAAWDTQFWIYFPDNPLKEGDSWEVSMDVRADIEASAGTQTHVGPGGYIHWAAIGTVNFTTDWETYTATGTASAEMNTGNAIAFNLNDFASANKYYFDNISFKINDKEVVVNGSCDDPAGTANFVAKEKRGDIVAARIIDGYEVVLPGGTTPQTPEEKRDTLTKAMDSWLRGIMEANAGKIVAWDAVKDVLASQEELDAAALADPSTYFCWQESMGVDEYVTLVFTKAREYFAEYGGVAADLKLFINENKLYDADKLSTLLTSIQTWETNDECIIDGIGTQLHVNFSLDADKQKAQEEAIEAMFKTLGETEKYIKLSELDMGIEDASGAVLTTDLVTEEQYQSMSQFYKFIVSKYFEHIPAAKQYGITQWYTSDQGATPAGIWDVNYGRKHTYAGFADGLQGK